MLTSIEIQNYKSISSIKIDLGRVNVFIGENGAGKSNILEAMALSGAACAEKLDNEFLVSRGVRVTDSVLMRPAFSGFSADSPVEITVYSDSGSAVSYVLDNDNSPYSTWRAKIKIQSKNEELSASDFVEAITNLRENEKLDRDELTKFLTSLGGIFASALGEDDDLRETRSVGIRAPDFLAAALARKSLAFKLQSRSLSQFVIFSPENSSLRMFEREGQIEPLGINGEGVLKLLTVLAETGEMQALESIKRSLRLLGWFKDFNLVSEAGLPGARLSITDSYLSEKRNRFDQRSANEGFLFLLFYFSLFSSKLTPSFFAVDNVDASLNPRLCQKLTIELVKLAKKYDKQVILTTHNPAVLDGLNLDDDDQRLFVVSRTREGYTRIRRFMKPDSSKSESGSAPLRLSEAFLRGSLGGLPKGF